MRTGRNIILLLGILVFLIQVDPRPVSAEEDCLSARIQMEAKRELLDQYLEALSRARIEKDHNLMSALNHSIGELIQEIGRLADATAECRPMNNVEVPGGLSPVRSDPGLHETTSCADLTKRHLQLSRKINSLSRRQQSLFSEPTPEERSLFRDAELELRTVQAEIKSRCSQPSPPPPARQRPKPRPGSAQR